MISDIETDFYFIFTHTTTGQYQKAYEKIIIYLYTADNDNSKALMCYIIAVINKKFHDFFLLFESNHSTLKKYVLS